MFSIDVKVNNKVIYTINGVNQSGKPKGFMGECKYLIDANCFEYEVLHVRKRGLLRLAASTLCKLCRNIEEGKVDPKQLETK